MIEEQKLQEGIETPHNNDVLSGRGNYVNRHRGNEFLRFQVNHFKFDYASSMKSQKPKFATVIYQKIKGLNPPGRFLKKDKDTDLWCDIGEKKAMDKIRQALREGVPDIINEMVSYDDEAPPKAPQQLPMAQPQVVRQKISMAQPQVVPQQLLMAQPQVVPQQLLMAQPQMTLPIVQQQMVPTILQPQITPQYPVVASSGFMYINPNKPAAARVTPLLPPMASFADTAVTKENKKNPVRLPSQSKMPPPVLPAAINYGKADVSAKQPIMEGKLWEAYRDKNGMNDSKEDIGEMSSETINTINSTDESMLLQTLLENEDSSASLALKKSPPQASLKSSSNTGSSINTSSLSTTQTQYTFAVPWQGKATTLPLRYAAARKISTENAPFAAPFGPPTKTVNNTQRQHSTGTSSSLEPLPLGTLPQRTKPSLGDRQVSEMSETSLDLDEIDDYNSLRSTPPEDSKQLADYAKSFESMSVGDSAYLQNHFQDESFNTMQTTNASLNFTPNDVGQTGAVSDITAMLDSSSLKQEMWQVLEHLGDSQVSEELS